MDYCRPIETIVPGVPGVPGVQGRILSVLAATQTELTMTTVARLADVSVNRAVAVLNHLYVLGIIQRREAGRSALVSLSRENEAARLIISISELRDRVIRRLQDEARLMDPAPQSLIVFGSLAREEATAGSDLDVAVVIPQDMSSDDPDWVNTLGRWSDKAREIVGNTVNLLIVSREELSIHLHRDGSVWQEIERDGILLVGNELRAITNVH